jgi:hypothetical protein
MHVLAITIQEIAVGLGAARPDQTLWRGDASRAFETNLESIISELISLGQQLAGRS